MALDILHRAEAEREGHKMRCLVCEKELEMEHKGGLPEEGYWSGANVDIFRCNYGSRFDTEKYCIGLCDDCLQSRIEKGIVVPRGKWCGPGSEGFVEAKLEDLKKSE